MQDTTPLHRLAAALAHRFADCRRRARQRRELAAMRTTDWGDLSVPPDLLAHELRRWPWQEPSPRWGEIATKRPTADDGAVRPADETRPPSRHPLRVALGVPRILL